MKKIKSYIPIEMKLFLTYILSKNTHCYRKFKEKKKIIVCLGADYGNLGDVAITISQIDYLKKMFPNYTVIEYPISETFKNFKSLKEVINDEDIITIVGGGNTTYKYRDIEYCRQFIIKNFNRNIILSFPQSVDLSQAPKNFKKRIKRVYGSHPKLCYFVREKYSYEVIKGLIPNLNCYLCPDIVLSYGIKQEEVSRSMITLTIRNDKERFLSDKEKSEIIDILHEYGNINYKDTQCADIDDFSMENRKKLLKNLLYIFSSSKLVVTDRLHGMILSYITNTPCIVLPCDNLKIKGCYEWIKNSNNVIYMDSFDKNEFKNFVDNFYNSTQISNKKIDFENMNEIILSILDKYDIKVDEKIENEFSK